MAVIQPRHDERSAALESGISPLQLPNEAHAADFESGCRGDSQTAESQDAGHA